MCLIQKETQQEVDIKQYPKDIGDLTNALTRKPTDPKILYKNGYFNLIKTIDQNNKAVFSFTYCFNSLTELIQFLPFLTLT